MGIWFSKHTSNIRNISSSITTAIIICSYLVPQMVNSNIITKTLTWEISDGNINCTNNDFNCTINCESDKKATCGSNNGLHSGPSINCPTNNNCIECNIYCKGEQACAGADIYGKNCQLLNIYVEGKNNQALSIYAPNNGSLNISVYGSSAKFKDSQIYPSSTTIDITIDCSGSEFKTNTVNATNIMGTLTYSSSGSCKSQDSIFYCPTTNTCTFNFDGSDTNTGIMITAPAGTPLMKYRCVTDCETTLICSVGTSDCITQCIDGACVIPTAFPTLQPTVEPTALPSLQPTSQPSMQPSSQPSMQPSVQPSVHPSQPSMLPSSQPTTFPSYQPSVLPSQPSILPSSQPSMQPSSQPSVYPSSQPSVHPLYQPSTQPSFQPSVHPSSQPSTHPSFQPSVHPSFQPSTHPSSQPSVHPSSQPSTYSSFQPSVPPSVQTTLYPSLPSLNPSLPSLNPSLPSLNPSLPSLNPTLPSLNPTSIVTEYPTNYPNIKATIFPSHLLPTSNPLKKDQNISSFIGNNEIPLLYMIIGISSLVLFCCLIIMCLIYRRCKTKKRIREHITNIKIEDLPNSTNHQMNDDLTNTAPIHSNYIHFSPRNIDMINCSPVFGHHVISQSDIDIDIETPVNQIIFQPQSFPNMLNIPPPPPINVELAQPDAREDYKSHNIRNQNLEPQTMQSCETPGSNGEESEMETETETETESESSNEANEGSDEDVYEEYDDDSLLMDIQVTPSKVFPSPFISNVENDAEVIGDDDDADGDNITGVVMITIGVDLNEDDDEEDDDEDEDEDEEEEYVEGEAMTPVGLEFSDNENESDSNSDSDGEEYETDEDIDESNDDNEI